MMKDFDNAVADFAVALRAELQKVESLSRFEFGVEISGRVHDGELKINYKCGEYSYSADKTEGGRATAVVKEFLRRKGWNEANAPLCLPNVVPVKA